MPTTPASAAGAKIATPLAPEVCTASWPACQAPVAASPWISPASSLSGTVSSTRSAWPTASSAGTSATPGSSRPARRLGLRADPGGGHHPVPGPAERGAQHRPDPTDPDDGNPQPRGVTGLDHG